MALRNTMLKTKIRCNQHDVVRRFRYRIERSGCDLVEKSLNVPKAPTVYVRQGHWSAHSYFYCVFNLHMHKLVAYVLKDLIARPQTIYRSLRYCTSMLIRIIIIIYFTKKKKLKKNMI